MKGRVFEKTILTLALILTSCLCDEYDGELYTDRFQTKQVMQGPPGYYFFEAFIGGPFQRRQLLIDTQANGTAVQYDIDASLEALVEKDMYGKVSLPSSQFGAYVDGSVVVDEFSFDADETIFADDFMFLAINFIKYKELESSINNETFNGVVGFNRFGFERTNRFGQTQGLQGKSNIMRALIDDYQLTNFTLQLDFNPMVDQKGDQVRSYISYNGLNTTNIKDITVHYFDNQLKDSKWVVELNGATLNNQNMF